MRTYSRHQPEYKELENVMNLCRLCLEKPDVCIPIYSDDSNLYSSLAVRIMICVGLEMTKEECVSNIICTKCHKELEQYYLFRKKCTKSYQTLKMHIQAVKTKAKERKTTQNMMFCVNPDGSIQMRDRSNGISESILGAAFDTTKQLNKVPGHPLRVNLPLDPAPSGSKDILLIKETVPPDPDISEFLYSMLTEIGLLTRHEDGSVDLNPNMSRSLELATRTGENIVFELVEEEEELENNSEECSKEEEIIKVNPAVSLVTDEENQGKSILPTGSKNKCKCVECGRVLASRSALARHERAVHARVKPFACPTCGKKFAQKEVMARHKLVHQEKRPFQCDKCPKSFTQRSSLETHSRFHTPWQERALTLHQCPHCPKMFLYNSGLSRHLQRHNNTQFPCRRCGRPFGDKSSLRRHEKTKRCAKPAASAQTLQAGQAGTHRRTDRFDTIEVSRFAKS